VRVNDRGPFVGERIIDLSYAAAVRLGMHDDGTALVDVEALDPRSVPGLPAVPVAEAGDDSRRTWLQVGAFADVRNAERLRARLEAEGIEYVSLAADSQADGTLHRVRIGPLGDVAAIEAMLARVRALEIPDAHLAHE
jgi:rare lipoprotein A